MSSRAFLCGEKMKINEIKSMSDLAYCLKLPKEFLFNVLKNEIRYSKKSIPKKYGGTRQLLVPCRDLKIVQKRLSRVLYDAQGDMFKHNPNYFENAQSHVPKSGAVSHAFNKGKSIMSNVEIHVRKKYIFKIDLENFFDSFNFGRVRGFFLKNKNFELSNQMATILAKLTCFEGKLPQGSPCSPIISNLIGNILDRRVVEISRIYHLDYTRYADDMTFSSNDEFFVNHIKDFYKKLNKIITKSGFKINSNKSKMMDYTKREIVTGLTVNSKISVDKNFRKNTRAMVDNLYKHGEFSNKYSSKQETMNALRGRLLFINQVANFDDLIVKDEKIHEKSILTSQEKTFQKFLFYELFWKNNQPLIFVEGKTDVNYIKAGLMNLSEDYPKLITKENGFFHYHFRFVKRNASLERLFGIKRDGADTFTNIFKIIGGKRINNLPQNNYLEKLIKNFGSASMDKKKLMSCSNKPVVFLFDNEKKILPKNNENKKGKIFPLRKAIEELKKLEFADKNRLELFLNEPNFTNLRLVAPSFNDCESGFKNKLYIQTLPLTDRARQAQYTNIEIEDLLVDDDLSRQVDGKKFVRESNKDNQSSVGKARFSEFIYKHYQEINFENFRPLFDELTSLVTNEDTNKI